MYLHHGPGTDSPTVGSVKPIDLLNLNWRIINDGVMGGLSRSRLDIQDGCLVFEGELSTENRGGFVSILARLDHPLQNPTHYGVTASGDGRRYQLRLRHSDSSRDVAWRAFFNTQQKVSCVHLDPQEFHPVMRGQPAIGARPLAMTPIHFIGFMLTSRRSGPFRLNVHALHVGHEAD